MFEHNPNVIHGHDLRRVLAMKVEQQPVVGEETTTDNEAEGSTPTINATTTATRPVLHLTVELNANRAYAPEPTHFVLMEMPPRHLEVQPYPTETKGSEEGQTETPSTTEEAGEETVPETTQTNPATGKSGNGNGKKTQAQATLGTATAPGGETTPTGNG